MSILDKQQHITASLVARRNSLERLSWLVAQARRRPALPEELRTDAHRVPGCLAKVWLVSEFREGRCWFRADSDSMVVKGIAGLLCELYDGELSADILAHDPGFLTALGITQHATPNRRNALAKVWQAMRAFAEQHVEAA